MKIITKTAILATLAVSILSGCKKDSRYTPAPTADKKIAATDTGVIITPFGPRLRSDVHFVEEGYALTLIDGHLKKIEKKTGKIMLDFGAQVPLKYLTQNRIQGNVGNQLVSYSNV